MSALQIHNRIRLIETALAEAMREQGADIEGMVSNLRARFCSDEIGVDGGPMIVFVDISQMAADLERNLP